VSLRRIAWATTTATALVDALGEAVCVVVPERGAEEHGKLANLVVFERVTANPELLLNLDGIAEQLLIHRLQEISWDGDSLLVAHAGLLS
jgi:hypothetical protein